MERTFEITLPVCKKRPANLFIKIQITGSTGFGDSIQGEEEVDSDDYDSKRAKTRPEKENIIIRQITPSKGMDSDFYLKNDKSKEWLKWPDQFCVPDHLVTEFTNMFANISSSSANSKTKNLSPSEQIGPKSENLLKALKNWWSLKRLEEFIKIVLKVKVDYTLSTLDCLLQNYAKNHSIKWDLQKKDGSVKEFDLNTSHSEMLKIFGRTNWSTYGRYKKIIIEFRSEELEKYITPNELKEDDTKKFGNAVQWTAKYFVGTRKINEKTYFYLMTTVGQLNLFHWAMKNQVLDYCEQNRKLIDDYRPKSQTGGKKSDE